MGGLINFLPLTRGGLIEDLRYDGRANTGRYGMMVEPTLAGNDWQCWSEINAKAITAVKDVRYSNATGRPGKIQACQDLNPDLIAILSGVAF